VIARDLQVLIVDDADSKLSTSLIVPSLKNSSKKMVSIANLGTKVTFHQVMM
jgi:hypothetical protein